MLILFLFSCANDPFKDCSPTGVASINLDGDIPEFTLDSPACMPNMFEVVRCVEGGESDMVFEAVWSVVKVDGELPTTLSYGEPLDGVSEVVPAGDLAEGESYTAGWLRFEDTSRFQDGPDAIAELFASSAVMSSQDWSLLFTYGDPNSVLTSADCWVLLD